MASIEDFFAAWGETDEVARADAIKTALGPTVYYADPRTPEPITDADALIAYVGMFSANAPGWTAKVVKSDVIAGWMRATVAFGGKGPDGSDMIQHGQYFVETNADGKATRMIGFAGLGDPE